MARLSTEQIVLRRRIAGHVRRLLEKHDFVTQADMAKRLGIDQGHLSNILNGKGVVGLDLVWRLHTVFRESLDYLCDTDPPAKYLPPENAVEREFRSPSEAAPSAQPG